jgi:2-polyprenyl-3-methyl-5-hydroxy-6-metoxy-1,4-benzoquinol methylase
MAVASAVVNDPDPMATRPGGREVIKCCGWIESVTEDEMTDAPVVGDDRDLSADAMVARIFEGTVAAFDLLSVVIGDRLGLYGALARDGSATSSDLAARAGIAERYAREWLEQQAASGIVLVDDATLAANERRFTLPPGHAEALIDPESPSSIAPLARSFAACARVLPELLDAYRTGRGVEWSDYGREMIEAQGDFNRPWLLGSFGSAYLPAVPEVDARLRADPPARVADVACGLGWASIAIAKAYPNVRVDGFDLDPLSIDLARANADAAGVGDRVAFETRDAGDPLAAGRYDLAVMIEALHDVSRPVEILQAMRSMLASGGSAIIADEKTEDRFTAPAELTERLFYGFSITCCLPAAMTDQPSAATGTVMRAETLREYAAAAGFRTTDVLDDIEHEALRFYRLTP